MTTLQVNGSAVAATTLAAAGKMFNATGGTSGNTSTKVGSGTLFKQIFAKGTTTGQTGVASIPAPTDSNFNGWMWDVTTLEGQNILAGTWTPTFHLLASTGTTVTPTVQWYKRSSGGVYTSIGSVAGSSIALTTSSQALTFTPPSLSSMAFATGDKLVMWLWVNQTAGGATNSTISVVEATSGSSAGVTSEAQAATPGYLPSKVTDSTGVRTRVRTASTKPYAATVLADSPIRYYRLGEASGTTATDLGSQATNGTLNGGITLGQAGALTGDSDTAELFNGTTGYINCSAYSTGLTAASLEAWINGPDLSNGTNGMMIVEVSTVNSFLELFIENGILKLRGGGVTTVSVAPPSNNAWHHIVGTISGTTGTLYIDGIQAATGAVNAIPTTSATLYIGCYDGAGYFFSGSIDEVAVYSTALSATQVQAHYKAGTTSKPYARILVPVRTQVTKSLGLRIVTSTSTLVTKVASLRTRVRTQKTVSAIVRTIARTQKTLSTPLHTMVRTLKTASTWVRVPVRTQKTASTVVRTLVRTQKTVSTGIRAVVKGMTKVANLRVSVRSLRSLSTSLRTRVRSQVSDSTVLRILARTAHSLSSPLRILVQSLKTKTTPLRIRARTQQSMLVSLLAVVASRVTRSSQIRAVIRGITRIVGLRVRIRTPHSLTMALRTVVSTGVNLVTKSAPLQVMVRTLKSVSTNLRVKVRSQVSKYSIIRTVVRSLHSLSTGLRIRARSQVSRSVQLRAVIRGITRLTVLRAPVSTKVSGVIVLRVWLVSLSTRTAALRTPVRSAHTPSAAIRVHVLILPNAFVLVRSGDASAQVRSGDASTQVRSGDATSDVRSGDASVYVRSGDAAVKVKE